MDLKEYAKKWETEHAISKSDCSKGAISDGNDRKAISKFVAKVIKQNRQLEKEIAANNAMVNVCKEKIKYYDDAMRKAEGKK